MIFQQKNKYLWLISCLIAILPTVVKATPAWNTGKKKIKKNK